MIPDYTLVVGVDADHLDQLEITAPTWWKHKTDLRNHRMLVFYDTEQVTSREIRRRVDHPDLSTFPWPFPGVDYTQNGEDRFRQPQRYKMLAGFVHVPLMANIDTPYWMKLDTDVVAYEQPDWIDEEWFKESPAIISHPWGFTKPADQMVILDEWVESNDLDKVPSPLVGTEPLRLIPDPGWERVKHQRITSWCSFYSMDFSRLCSQLCNRTNPLGMPVPSQDGFMWYVAKRLGLPIVRSSMKKRGFHQWKGFDNIRKSAEEAMRNG